MIELSLEIPTPHLGEFMPSCDLGFALAQEVLNDKMYCDFYNQYEGELILDNGMLETGESLSVSSLWHANKMIKPAAIIAPDAKDAMEYGFSMYKAMVCGLQSTWDVTNIGFVVQGKTLGERVWSLRWAIVHGCNPICLPYRTNRIETWVIYNKTYGTVPHNWIHLLGLRDHTELTFWRDLSDRYRISLDTGKVFEVPIEDFALGNFKVESKEQLPIDRTLGPGMLKRAHANIEILKARLK
jgi:hypothetical protein